MKNLTLLGLLAMSLPLQAGVLIFDSFSYADGNLVTNSGGLWNVHSPSTPNGDALVSGGRYQINQTRFDDVNRVFDPPNDQALNPVLYASFTINVSEIPATPNGTYLAHFKDDTALNYVARLFVVTTNTIVPGTYRLGVANAATAATAVFPMDLAVNTDYQVVLSYDTFNLTTTLWIDPGSQASPSVSGNDIVSGAAAIMTVSSFAFRQAAGEGVLAVDQILVGTGYGDVATNTPVSPSVVINPVSTNVYAGTDVYFAVVARGTGPLSYQWRRNGSDLSDGGNISGATSSVLLLTGVTGGNSGDYDVVVTGAAGSTNSLPAALAVDTSSTAPIITGQPASVTNFPGTTVKFTVTATGTAPLSYQWNFYGTNLPGATTSALTLPTVTNENAGPYFCSVQNSVGTRRSDTASLVIRPPVATNIAYLRTLQDTNWLPNDTTTVFEAVGTVITFTNLTTAGNAQFYIQDDTGGIDVFVAGGSTLRPRAGDRVKVVAPLTQFNSLLELAPAANNPGYGVTTIGTDYPMPPARAFYFGETNNLAVMERVVEGSLVTVTNVYFPAANGTTKFGVGSNVTMTNEAGQTFILRIDGRVTGFGDIVIPAFAYQVTGVMSQFLNASATDRKAGYQLTPSRVEDLVVVLPPAPQIDFAQAGTTSVLKWPAVAGSTYSIYAAGDLSAAWTRLAFGLNFLGAEGQFTATNGAPSRYYRLSTP